MRSIICNLLKFVNLIVAILLLNNTVFAKDKFLCVKEILKVEKYLNLPKNILLAISLTETGRLIDNMYLPWPWSLNVKGKGFYLDSEEQAKQYALSNIKNFTKNVDIGCMQINYYYHGSKFKKFDDMINPRINVLWAGYFLIDLKKRHGTWKEAIMRYHSSNPRRKKNYYRKVLNNWSYLGTDYKTTKVNKKYRKVISSIENYNLDEDNTDLKISEKYALEESIVVSEGYSKTYSSDQNEVNLLSKEIPKFSEELLFINEFTYMSREDILNNLERIKDFKENNK